MPYSGPDDPDIPSNVPEKDKAQWVEIWNKTFADCMKEDGAKKDACETKAFKYANGVIKKKEEETISPAMFSLRQTFNSLMKQISAMLHKPVKEERAFSMPSLYDMVFAKLDEVSMKTGVWIWLVDVYMEEGNFFAILAKDGALYKSDIIVDEKFMTLTMSEMQKVVPKFEPITDTGIQMMRQVDGSTRIFLISGTSVINRNGQIDSRKLFDNMTERVKEAETKPYIDFFHLGKNFLMGEIDYMDRDGNVGIASGILEDNELTRAWISVYTNNPAYWGSSISFFPLGTTEMLEITEGITIPMYVDGICNAIAILPEKDACALYTAVSADRTEITRMDERIKSALKLLAGDDEELLNKFIAKVDETNRAIDESGAIAREVSANVPATIVEVPVLDSTIVEPQPVQSIELNAEAIQQIRDAIMTDSHFVEFVNNINKMIDASATVISQMSVTLATVQALVETQAVKVREAEEQITALKESEEEKKRAWLTDLSATSRASRVTFRPREKRSEPENKKSLDNIAEATLSNIQQ